MNLLKVAVVDDHPLFRTGVTRTLLELGLDVVAEGATAQDAVKIAAMFRPDVLLLDISLPGNGLDAIGPAIEAWPRLKVIMLTASESPDHVKAALRMGASGYILKGVGSDVLAEVIASVNNGDQYLPPTLTAKLIASRSTAMPSDNLSTREHQVLELIATGLSNKHVARQLGLQEKTVKHHMTKIFTKLGVSNRTEAALLWSQSRDDRP